MRCCAALLLLLGTLTAVELPTLTRQDPVKLTYDLAATAPWMPVLWDQCALTLPPGTTACKVVAQLISVSTTIGVDGSDLLALREGHRLTMDNGIVTVAGSIGTWNGVRSGTSPLVASFDGPIDASTLLLLCRQLHYANLGGGRTLSNRRVKLTVRTLVAATWLDSLPLTIDIVESLADQAPKLRFDDLIVPLGGSVPWEHQGWYDGRQQADNLRWRIVSLPASAWVSGLVGDVRGDQTALLTSTYQNLGWFTADQLQMQGRTNLGTIACRVQASDGSLTSSTAFNVTVVSPSGGLEVVGDFPFVITGPTVLTFHASRSDAVLARCLTHPATGDMQPLATLPFTATSADGTITLSLDPANLTGGELAGCAEFAAGAGTASSSTFRLPYRIQLAGGSAN